MAGSRDTMTLDLLGLESRSAPGLQGASSGVDGGRPVKITVRLEPRIAERMTVQARAAGLSQGVYLSTLIAGAPAVLIGADHRRAVAALTASNDEIARMAAAINGLLRRLRCGEVPSAGEVDATLEALAPEVRAHLRHASQLIADLGPLVAIGGVGAARKTSPGGTVR
jgi:hypothetical protein